MASWKFCQSFYSNFELSSFHDLFGEVFGYYKHVDVAGGCEPTGYGASEGVDFAVL